MSQSSLALIQGTPAARHCEVAADTAGNFSTHALRAEMHNIRVFDTHAAQLEHDIEDCKSLQSRVENLSAFKQSAI